MPLGFRFRAYPTPSVSSVLLRWIGCQRYIKNAKVYEDQYYRAFQRRFVDFAGQHAPVDQSYAHLIGDGCGNANANSTWLREVPSPVLRNGASLFYTGYQRFFKGLAKRPSIKSRHGEQTVWLTSELFRFEDVIDADGEVVSRRLHIGTKKFPCGELEFTVNKGARGPDGRRQRLSWSIPASIHISVNAGRWHVSFSNEATDTQIAPSEKDTLDYLRQFSESELLARTIGLDRGVTVPLMGATPAGQTSPFALMPIQMERLKKKEIARQRWQKRSARRIKGSRNRGQANHMAAKAGRYAASVREDFAHKCSHALVASDHLLFVFEALQVKNMTKRAKAKVDPVTGKWLMNGAGAKTGLNKAILGSCWGRVKQYTKYKAQAAGKLTIAVPAQYSSQECAHCGHTHAENRPDQARFICQRCAHHDNADANAGRVLAARGAKAVCSGSYTLKAKKKVGGLRGKPKTTSPKEAESTIGQELSESTPVEIMVSRGGGNTAAHRSQKQEFLAVIQETPTISLL